MCKPRTHFFKPVQNIPENMVKTFFTTLKMDQNKSGMPAYIRTSHPPANPILNHTECTTQISETDTS
jgi:hypothetical protein